MSSRTTAWRSNDRFATALLLTLAVGVTFWVRTEPLRMSGLDRYAEAVVRASLEQELEHSGESVESWISHHQNEFEERSRTEYVRLTEQFRYTASDGEQRVYPGGWDGYTWLRFARNIVETGTPCDQIVNGECRDTLANAPFGRGSIYYRSLHIHAIVWMHRCLTFFRPAFPLEASAFWLQAIIGALVALPAFWIGRQLGGDVGGLSAALAIGTNSLFLRRSLGGDNDVWNVALPLLMTAAAIAAVAAQRFGRSVLFGLLAAAAAALHSQIWSGWIFFYLVCFFGLLAHLGAEGVRAAVRGGPSSVWRCDDVRRGFMVLSIFAGTLWLASTVIDISPSPLGTPWQYFSQLLLHPSAAFGAESASRLTLTWPDNFSGVAELSGTTMAEMQHELGGALLFALGYLGMTAAAAPPQRIKWWHVVLLALAGVVYLMLFQGDARLGGRLHLLVTLPVVVMVVAEMTWGSENSTAVRRAATLIVLVWFSAALSMASGGVRFLLLVVPPLGLGLGAALGSAQQILIEAMAWLGRRPARVVDRGIRMAAFVAALAAAWPGYAIARVYIPRMDDMWWDTLTRIRQESPSDAIVNAWWDDGYWIEYAARRRVLADGASLNSRILYWMARAWLAPTERQTAGFLRMLDCSSDLAYSTITAAGVDELRAHGLIAKLASMGKDTTRSLLSSEGIADEAAQKILSATHCAVPPAFLILSSDLTTAMNWKDIGAWDFRRAYILNDLRAKPVDDAVREMVSLLGYSEPEARALYAEASALKSVNDFNQFLGLTPGYLVPYWLPCNASENGQTLTCPVGAIIDDQDTRLDSFVFQSARPGDSSLVMSRAAKNGGRESGKGIPASLLLADESTFQELQLSQPSRPDMAVLVDLIGMRILIGPPSLLRSTFTKLLFLDRSYSGIFQKFDDRTGFLGGRVASWRIQWP